jgi:uncharacterized protein (TIGR03067 family)
MTRLVVLLLALGLLVHADVSRTARSAEDKPKTEKADKEKDKENDKGKPEADEKPSKEARADLKKISGTFLVTTFEREGRKYSDEELKKMWVVQKGAEWSFHSDGDVTTGVDRVYPDKTPKEIDSTYTSGSEKGKTVKGIYEVDGDTVKYCWADVGTDRPKDFTTRPGSGLTLMILKKGKPPVKPAEKEKEEGKEKPREKEKE